MAITEFTLNPPSGSAPPSRASSTPRMALMNARRLTVSCRQQDSRCTRPSLRSPPPMPFLRLQGRWLDRAGFAIGASVRVLVTPRRLVLEVIESESAVQPASGDERFFSLATSGSPPARP